MLENCVLNQPLDPHQFDHRGPRHGRRRPDHRPGEARGYIIKDGEPVKLADFPIPGADDDDAPARLPDTPSMRSWNRRSLQTVRDRIIRRDPLGQLLENGSQQRVRRSPERRRARGDRVRPPAGRSAPSDVGAPGSARPGPSQGGSPESVPRAKQKCDFELVEGPGQDFRTHGAGRGGGRRVVGINPGRSSDRQRSPTPRRPVHLRQPVGEQQSEHAPTPLQLVGRRRSRNR